MISKRVKSADTRVEFSERATLKWSLKRYTYTKNIDDTSPNYT